MNSRIKEKILEKIKSGQITMRSRTYFLLHAALMIFSLAITFFVGWFLIGVLFFLFNQAGVWHLSIFGISGFLAFLSSFSWIVLLIGLASLVVFEIVLKKFPFGYKNTLLYSVLVFAAIILIGNMAVNAAGLNNRLHGFLQKQKIPVVNKIYESQGEFLKRNIISGQIQEITSDGFILNNDEKGQVKIKVNNFTAFPSGNDLKIGEDVFVGIKKTDIGNMEEIKALGVEKMNEREIREQKKSKNEKQKIKEIKKREEDIKKEREVKEVELHELEEGGK